MEPTQPVPNQVTGVEVPGSTPAYPPGIIKAPAGHKEVLITVLPGADQAGSIMSRAGGKATASLIAEAML